MAKAKRTADYNGIFAVRLRECMEKQGISQSELADEIGKTRQAVNFYTLGKTVPDADTLALISIRLDISADYLLGLPIKKKVTAIKNSRKLIAILEKTIGDLNRAKKQLDKEDTLAGMLVAVREEKGIKRQQAADGIGITRSSLEYYEKGKRTPDAITLQKICDFYNISADYLLS